MDKTKNIKVLGKPVFELTLKDIPPLITFYITPWSYNPITGELDLDASVDYPGCFSGGGSATLPVKRLLNGVYQVDLRKLDYAFHIK